MKTYTQEALLESARALQLMQRHYNDLGDSNPGFMGKLSLQDYGLWNEALLAMDRACAMLKNGKPAKKPNP